MPARKFKRSKPSSRELLEVVDADNRVVGLMPGREIHDQKLMHRGVLVMLYNAERKLYLHKRSAGKRRYPHCWDLSATGHVWASESPKEAAIRKLRDKLGIAVTRLNLVKNLHVCDADEFEFVSLFTAGVSVQVPQPNPSEVQKGIFVEKHELDYLLRSFADQFTPEMHSLWKLDLLFP